jgi:hypothetical protein
MNGQSAFTRIYRLFFTGQFPLFLISYPAGWSAGSRLIPFPVYMLLSKWVFDRIHWVDAGKKNYWFYETYCLKKENTYHA